MAKDRSLNLKLRAVDRMSKLITRVQRTFPKFTRSIKRASRVSRTFNAQTARMRKNITALGSKMKSFGRNFTTFVTLPIIAGGIAAVKVFADYEQGLRGIEKTTDLTRKQTEELGRIFSQLSTEIPVSTEEMLELAKAGGQLGVKGKANIEKFTIVMAKLSRTTDVVGEAGAKSIARILTVTGDGIGKIDRFASALVDLGNNAAASEQEILEVANRVAGQIGRFDVASDKVLGIATALRALGKRAESSGSVMGRAFDAIDQSIRKSGDQMRLLSRLTGITQKDLKQAFQKDASAVFKKFVDGLGKVEKGGGNVIKVLSLMGLQGVRINDILGTLAKRPEVLAESLERATRAARENTAANREFEIQTDSLGSEMKLLFNTLRDLFKLIGDDLAPVARVIGGIFKDIFNFLRNNPAMRTLVIVLAAVLAVMGPLVFILGVFLVLLPGLIGGLAALGVTSFVAFLPFTLIPLAIAAVIAILALLLLKWESISAFLGGNPFDSFLDFVLSLLSPIRLVLKAINALTFSFFKLKKAKAGADGVPDVVKRFAAFGDKKFGPAAGAARQNQNIATQQSSVEVGGRIGITLGGNIPSGTRASVQSSGPVGLDFGLAGVLQ